MAQTLALDMSLKPCTISQFADNRFHTNARLNSLRSALNVAKIDFGDTEWNPLHCSIAPSGSTRAGNKAFPGPIIFGQTNASVPASENPSGGYWLNL